MTLSEWQSMGYDTHSMIADPEEQIFVDHLNSNYHILQNAQVVNTGTNLVLPTVFEDLDNVSRPQGSGFDIGCYEYNTLTSVKEEIIADDFILYQNYPNPFNPTTKISWQSLIGSWQSLKVYDVLGNEVATLVDEFKPEGKYEVEFNAKELPSGIYFYRLNVGSFTQTKSTVLLK
jgi:hypothetical protein